jgi:hypothetical protein
MSREAPRLHDDDTVATAPMDPGTVSAVDNLKSSFGTSASGQLAALASALGTLSDALTAAINDKSSKLKTLPANKNALAQASLEVPSVQPTGLEDAAKTITNILSGIYTPDTAKVQKAILMASTVRDPSQLEDFQNSKIDLVSDQTNQEMSELNELLKSVNGFKKQVESA